MKSLKWLKANTWDKWSLTTKILLLLPIIITILIFGYQQLQHNNDSDFLNEQFLKTQEICSQGNTNCIMDKPTGIIFVDQDKIAGDCPYVQLKKEANTTFSEGTISFWTKTEKDYNTQKIGEATFVQEGKINGALKFSGIDKFDNSKEALKNAADVLKDDGYEVLIDEIFLTATTKRKDIGYQIW